jgi:hypothetical protein
MVRHKMPAAPASAVVLIMLIMSLPDLSARPFLVD